MKREIKILLYANLFFVLFFLYYTFDLHMLIVDNTLEDSIPSEDIAPNSTLPIIDSQEKILIPKIIHQTYKDENIPSHWQAGQAQCKSLNPDYEYILWTDEMIEDFISEEFPWFLPTLKSYKYPIQKADVIRYFVLWKYGGIYVDLDDTCQRSFDPLLKYPVFLRKTAPFGVSNDVMGAIPNHPFFYKAIHSLKHYNKNWYAPYFTIMASTGPVFISIMWKQYKRWEKIKQYWNPNYHYIDSERSVRILQPWDYKDYPTSFFTISKGSSWHLDDANFIKSFLTHILSCVVAGFIIGFILLYGEYCIYCFMCSKKDYSLASTWNSVKEFISNSRAYMKLSNDNDDYNSYYYSSPGYENNRKTPSRLRKDSNNLIHMIDLERNINTRANVV